MTYAPPAADRNAMAMVAFFLGLASVLSALIFVVLQAFAINSGSIESLAALNGVRAFFAGVLGLMAIITGAIALVGPKPRKPFAAVGLALGAAEVFNVILGLLTGLIYTLAG